MYSNPSINHLGRSSRMDGTGWMAMSVVEQTDLINSPRYTRECIQGQCASSSGCEVSMRATVVNVPWSYAQAATLACGISMCTSWPRNGLGVAQCLNLLWSKGYPNSYRLAPIGVAHDCLSATISTAFWQLVIIKYTGWGDMTENKIGFILKLSTYLSVCCGRRQKKIYKNEVQLFSG